MKTVLVITSYQHEGKRESFARPYLPYEGESAEDQARDFWSEHKMTSDPNTKVVHTPHPLAALSPVERVALLQEDYDPRSIAAICGRICALEAFAKGSPPIPEDQLFGEWSQSKDANEEDYAFFASVAGPMKYTELFKEAYLKNLFDVSDCE